MSGGDEFGKNFLLTYNGNLFKENLPGFEGCEATMRFIRIFDKLFDILNSRTLRSWGLKKPMQASQKSSIFFFKLVSFA